MLSGKDYLSREKTSTLIPNDAGVEEDDWEMEFFFQLSLGQKSEFPQVFECFSHLLAFWGL